MLSSFLEMQVSRRCPNNTLVSVGSILFSIPGPLAAEGWHYLAALKTRLICQET